MLEKDSNWTILKNSMKFVLLYQWKEVLSAHVTHWWEQLASLTAHLGMF